MPTWQIVALFIVGLGVLANWFWRWDRDLSRKFNDWNEMRKAIKSDRNAALLVKRLIEQKWLLKKHQEEYAEIEKELRTTLPEEPNNSTIRSNARSNLGEKRAALRELIYKLQTEIEWLETQYSWYKKRSSDDESDTLPPADKREALKKVRVDISHLREEEERIEQELIEEQGGQGPYKKQARIPTDD